MDSFPDFVAVPGLFQQRTHALQAPKVKTPEELEKEAFEQKLTAYQSQIL